MGDAGAPYYTDVDYVEVHRYDAETKTVLLNFRDDFDTWDQNRWASSDNKTWEGKDSTLKKENAYVRDGRPYLRMDKNNDYPSDDDEHSGDDSHDEDFHVLPAPKDGTLDAAIEKATRVGVVMVRQYLDHFSSSMSHHLQ